MTVRFFKPFLEALLIAIDTAHRLDCGRKAEPNFVDHWSALLSLWISHLLHFDVIQQFFQDGPRIEAAFRKHLHRADVDQVGDSVEIYVCHANVIRYFVCR